MDDKTCRFLGKKPHFYGCYISIIITSILRMCKTGLSSRYDDQYSITIVSYWMRVSFALQNLLKSYLTPSYLKLLYWYHHRNITVWIYFGGYIPLVYSVRQIIEKNWSDNPWHWLCRPVDLAWNMRSHIFSIWLIYTKRNILLNWLQFIVDSMISI